MPGKASSQQKHIARKDKEIEIQRMRDTTTEMWWREHKAHKQNEVVKQAWKSERASEKWREEKRRGRHMRMTLVYYHNGVNNAMCHEVGGCGHIQTKRAAVWQPAWQHTPTHVRATPLSAASNSPAASMCRPPHSGNPIPRSLLGKHDKVGRGLT